ncbi:MAG: S46 family peptidase [Bacteroidia bacterium]|nr:S46 family peptidase [Bacteroidia bacterium]
MKSTKNYGLWTAPILAWVAITNGLFATEIHPPAVHPPDEGMWMPLLIGQNHEEMRRMGLELTPEMIYSANQSSLKDAIVWFGGFCTGEIISPEGLILTNHHCGYDAIQSLSTVQNDYLTNGFWATNKESELPCAGLSVSFLVRMEDVSARFRDEIPDNLPEDQRAAKVQQLSAEIVKNATAGTHYRAMVKDMFYGSEYYLFVYEDFPDVRLVGTPPEAVGKYGGDTDNWMWPRHTGDFSIFRVYAGKDGKPAPYSKDNVPYKPKHFLPISLEGVKPGDFAMVFGFPGRTNRYLVSEAIKMAQELTNPARIRLRDTRLKIWKEDMDANPAVRLQYASKYAAISNYWKYFIGQNKGLKRLKTVEQKQKLEKEFNAWAAADPQRQAKYGAVIENLKKAVENFRPYALGFTYVNEALFAPEILALALRSQALAQTLPQDKKIPRNEEAIAKAVADFKKSADEHFKDYHPPTDKKVFATLLKMYYDDVPKDQHPAVFNDVVVKKYKGDFNKFAEDVFAKSIFADKAKLEAFLKKPEYSILAKDPAWSFANACLQHVTTKVRPPYAAYEMEVAKWGRLYIAGLREWQARKKFYPDANSTLRLTYGKVKDYKPMDAVHYDYITYLDGVMEKEDPSNPEFIVPKRLAELYEKKDYGRYADNTGRLPVCFITDNDITGGNSGSPVIDGKGRLIGLAFDGNWEAMTGDLVFDPELKRTINVDIRYVLFIIDKYAGASNLIQEMRIVGG